VKQQGFTLAELLIALTILGVIATFTIPKVLNSSATGSNKAVAKEVAAMISEAFTARVLSTPVAAANGPATFTTNMNFVRVDTDDALTNSVSETALTCSTAEPCMILHNGAYLQYDAAQTFTGTASTNFIEFNVDPDGVGTSAGTAKFVLYANGRLTTRGNASLTAVLAADPTTDPTWIATWN
jgi:prepilin-type N-terminal cleavage/methylation domain-containing protein